MGKYIGYAVIILLHFVIKGCSYTQLEKTKGVVVDERTFRYGRPFRQTDIVPYPIAQFKGPLRTQRMLKRIYAPEEHVSTPLSRDLSEGEKAELLSTLENLPDSIKEAGVNELIGEMQSGKAQLMNPTSKARGKIFDTTYIDSDDYTTTTPWGAYFFGRYRVGDSIEVIYNINSPAEGRVCTFFSYWLTLPAICFIILASIIWTGIYNMATRKSY